MKTIGLLGGMSWESTALYYRLINEEHTDVRMYDTTRIHAEQAVALALGDVV